MNNLGRALDQNISTERQLTTLSLRVSPDAQALAPLAVRQ
jgi:hypothetical protein